VSRILWIGWIGRMDFMIIQDLFEVDKLYLFGDDACVVEWSYRF